MAIVFIIDGIIAIVITITVAAAAVVNVITVVAPAVAVAFAANAALNLHGWGNTAPQTSWDFWGGKININFSLPLLSYDGSLLSIVSLLPPMPSLPPLSCHRCHGHRLHH
jgi:hypothetical protein